MEGNRRWERLQGVIEMRLIRFEYRKLWNKISVTVLIAFLIFSTLHTFIYLNLQWRTLDGNGNVWEGLRAYRILKEVSKDVEGAMDEQYLERLIKDYNASVEKEYLDRNGEHRGFLGTGGMTKYMFPNYCINYAYYGPYMTNGNDKIGLDYEFISSENSFYDQYREAIKEDKITNNTYGGLFPYSDSQISKLEDKIQEIKTPFTVEYYQGIANMLNWYAIQFPYFLVALVFTMAGVYAKDSEYGVDEMMLASKKGRQKDFKAKWISGNCFAATVYFIFVGVLMLEHGGIASLHGWNASAQTFWYDCIYNITVGTGTLLQFLGGMLGSLVIANLTMFFSAVIRNGKVSILAVLAILYALRRFYSPYGLKKIFSPLYFGESFVVKDGIFIGEILVPCMVLVFVLSLFYILVFRLCIRSSAKKYHIGG